jgi:hypothetical protein
VVRESQSAVLADVAGVAVLADVAGVALLADVAGVALLADVAGVALLATGAVNALAASRPAAASPSAPARSRERGTVLGRAVALRSIILGMILTVVRTASSPFREPTAARGYFP